MEESNPIRFDKVFQAPYAIAREVEKNAFRPLRRLIIYTHFPVRSIDFHLAKCIRCRHL